MKIKAQCQSGLSIVEVCIVVAAIALLASLFLPSLQGSKCRPSQFRCINNLKQAALGFLVLANDGDGQFPWASTNAGGTRAFAESLQVFRHFLAASNELVTPKILVCPKDKQRREAWDFSKFSNQNISYFLNIDASTEKPLQFLSGDRNITGGTLSNGFLRLLNPADGNAGWTPELHNNSGNIGLADGSVQQVTPAQLRDELEEQHRSVVRLAIP